MQRLYSILKPTTSQSCGLVERAAKPANVLVVMDACVVADYYRGVEAMNKMPAHCLHRRRGEKHCGASAGRIRPTTCG